MAFAACRKGFHPRLWKNINFLRSSSITKWNKDWKPGPYPRTEEERLAAARKYNLIPEDYKPFPEEEGYGDYPDLEPVSATKRNPYELFDYPHLRKNYGEPPHADFDSYTLERIDPEQKFPMSMPKMILFQIGMVVVTVALITLGEMYPSDTGMLPKQFPHRGVEHYTFETVEENS